MNGVSAKREEKQQELWKSHRPQDRGGSHVLGWQFLAPNEEEKPATEETAATPGGVLWGD